jgi:hypothetical protein
MGPSSLESSSEADPITPRRGAGSAHGHENRASHSVEPISSPGVNPARLLGSRLPSDFPALVRTN